MKNKSRIFTLVYFLYILCRKQIDEKCCISVENLKEKSRVIEEGRIYSRAKSSA
jgi:hypothetical protein